MTSTTTPRTSIPRLSVNEPDLSPYRHAFALYDTDGTGCITLTEVAAAAKELGVGMDDVESLLAGMRTPAGSPSSSASSIMSSVPSLAASSCTCEAMHFEEFAELMTREFPSTLTPRPGGAAGVPTLGGEPVRELETERLSAVFTQYDRDQDGYLDASDLMHALGKYAGMPVPPQEAEEIMNAANPDGSGLLDMASFIDLMREAYNVTFA